VDADKIVVANIISRIAGHGAGRLVLAAAAVAALAGAGACKSTPSGSAASRPGGPAAETRAVQLVVVAPQPLARTVVGQGTLVADEQATLSFKVSGRVASIVVDLGSRVRRGDVVARLDQTDFDSRVRQAEASLQQARARLGLNPTDVSDSIAIEQTSPVREAKALLDEAAANLARSRKLAEGGVMSRAELDSSEAAYKVADARYHDALDEARNRQSVLAQRKSELELARQQRDDTSLRAPFDGAIAARRAGVGEVVAVGAPVVDLVRMNPLRMRAEIPERNTQGVAVGKPVRVRVEQAAGEHAGRVSRMSPVVNENNRVLLVEIEVDNASGALRPGSFATAEITTAVEGSALMAPASAVVTFAGIEKTFTVKDGKAVERIVTTGRRDGASVEITSGLEPGEQIVAEPGNLVTGQPVVLEGG
jgi:RND family efflux transporter MFP subunit